jgi:hypothetical protein
MKLKCKFLILIGVMALSGHCKAQLNLVPNPSFEDTVNCMLSGIGGIATNTCDKWYSCKYSPDYWTGCSMVNSIPNTGPSLDIPPKLTPPFRSKLTPLFQRKLTPLFRTKLTPFYHYFHVALFYTNFLA